MGRPLARALRLLLSPPDTPLTGGGSEVQASVPGVGASVRALRPAGGLGRYEGAEGPGQNSQGGGPRAGGAGRGYDLEERGAPLRWVGGPDLGSLVGLLGPDLGGVGDQRILTWFQESSRPDLGWGKGSVLQALTGGGSLALGGSVQGLALMCTPTGLYGADGILPARKTLRPQGKGRWQQLWETPTLLWEAPQLGLDTAQGLELLSLLGALLALGALLLRRLRTLPVCLLLWAAYLSAYQASGGRLLHPAPLKPVSPTPPALSSLPLTPVSAVPAAADTPSTPRPDSPSPCRWARCFFISSGECGVRSGGGTAGSGWRGICPPWRGPSEGSSLDGEGPFVLSVLPIGTPCCWRLASWPCWWPP